jgi:hypothetical protein
LGAVSAVFPKESFTFAGEMLSANALITRFRPLPHLKTGNG